MHIRKPVTLAIVAALTLAACGDDDDTAVDTVPAEAPASEDSMADDTMADDTMADDTMADDTMADDTMADDTMADDTMADDTMADDTMADDTMADDTMADDTMADDTMADDTMADDTMADDTMADDTMADDTMADDTMAEDTGVVSVAAGRDDLTTLVTAIQAAGLAEALHGAGPFTVFAPTDAAFEAYLGEMGMTAEDVLADTAALTALLQAHVVAGNDDSAMVMDMADQSFTTLAGTPLAVTVEGDTVMVGGATIVEYDLAASNGVVHVIDAVLSPAG